LNPKPLIRIVTPAAADANNGNWRTAHRWKALLSDQFRVILQGDWQGEPCDALVALHARRSAKSIQKFRDAFPTKPLVVTLTGTDLYNDLKTSEAARQSLSLADTLIVLQEDAVQYVPLPDRHKARVIYQSANPLAMAKKINGKLNCVVVGHLRKEKDPETIFRFVERMREEPNVRVLHIGAPLDAALGKRAKALMAAHPSYRWAGPLAHGLTRAAIKRAHVLIHPSVMEGGANVIVEAITAGTPVLASRMSGNVGMLGQKYEGYFPVASDELLAELAQNCLYDAKFLLRLNQACQARAKLFLPSAERDALTKVLHKLLLPSAPPASRQNLKPKQP
jgi:putative glycosyltransferase (TIGR04348 family)